MFVFISEFWEFISCSQNIVDCSLQAVYVSLVLSSIVVHVYLLTEWYNKIKYAYSIAGYLIYFITTLVAACEGWLCWSHGCGFILMGMPPLCRLFPSIICCLGHTPSFYWNLDLKLISHFKFIILPLQLVPKYCF